MKLALCLLLAVPFFAQAEVVNNVEYKVVGSRCVTSSIEPVDCAPEYTSVKFVRDQKDGEIQFQQISEDGDMDIYFLNNANEEDDREALVVDDQMKRLVYSQSREVFSVDPDYVIDTISLNIEFYQLDATRAVLLHSYTRISVDEPTETVQYIVQLEKVK